MPHLIEKDKPVVVTGATSYVGGWVIKKLLEEGVTVHACVRNPDNKDKIKHLEALKSTSTGSIKYFKSDLLEEGSYEDAMSGCSVVFHIASPFILSVKDAQKDLVDPAKIGTRNVLESANRIESVKRVVLTSSVAAIYGDNADLKLLPNNTITEENWNTTSSLSHSPYFYSKTVAEKEANKIHSQQDRWDLVVLNPSLVLGPSLSGSATSESFNIITQMGSGQMKTGVPNLGLGAVDVRDVAEAQVRAAFDNSASGRYIISGHNTSLLEIAQQLSPEYDSYPLPRRAVPKPLVWLVGPLLNKGFTRKYVSQNVNHPFKADSSKSVRELDMKYRPLKESVTDMFQQLIDTKQI